MKKAWPPQRLREVEAEKSKFNDFFWMVDNFGQVDGQ